MAVKKTEGSTIRVESHAPESGEITNGVHAELEALAYQLWMERGSPLGSPEIDWFQAEARIQAELHARASARRRETHRVAPGLPRES